MKIRYSLIVTALLAIVPAVSAQMKSASVLSSDDLKNVAPTSFFYRGKTAATQLRNTGGVRTSGDKYVLAGLVDTSGYAASVAEKYQGFFITEVKLKVEGSELAPGEYGFGFTGDKFLITDAGANELLGVSFKTESDLKRPVPLKFTKEGDAYRLYAGKKYVTLQPE